MSEPQTALTSKLINALYTEAMLLADEARSYFDRDPASAGLPATIAVAFSCESLKVTTRLMHSIAWLLHQKAIQAGEISAYDAHNDAHNLGYAPATDTIALGCFPHEAQELIQASEDLYFRLQRVQMSMQRQIAEAPKPHQYRELILQAF
jgi:regulator of CtrA degradation